MAEIFSFASLLNDVAILTAIIASAITTAFLIKPLMKKMRERRMTGVDWNKKDKMEIPELGGIAILFGFPIGISVATGLLKLFDQFYAAPILAAIGALFIGGMIGLIDDISDIPQRIKAVAVAFAALPVILAGFGDEIITLPFNFNLDFTADYTLNIIYWLIIVPIGITGAANAINMSAGYNGLETGQVAIISLSLLLACIAAGRPFECILIFCAVFGSSIALNYYNSYPAMTFVGDVGTLSTGAVIGAGAIMSGLELAGIIAIAPVFFELGSTIYYSTIKKIDRKAACASPILDEEGRLHPPKGSERFTLAFFILSKKPMTEPKLVRTILMLYVVSGFFAILVSII